MSPTWIVPANADFYETGMRMQHTSIWRFETPVTIGVRKRTRSCTKMCRWSPLICERLLWKPTQPINHSISSWAGGTQLTA